MGVGWSGGRRVCVEWGGVSVRMGMDGWEGLGFWGGVRWGVAAD